jgi:DUF1365 family protein
MTNHIGKPFFTDSPALLMDARVLHDRVLPRRHRFVYSVFCLRVNIDALQQLRHWWLRSNGKGLLGIHERDYGPRDGSALSPWIRSRLNHEGLPADGEIWLQTFPRVLGYAFNPVSFWLCHDRQGNLVALLAEVNNTFGQHHSYLLAAPDKGPITEGTRLQCLKTFHVSPFLKPEGHYEFRLREGQGTSYVAIDYYDAQNNKVLHTSIGGRLHTADRTDVLLAVARRPLMTFFVITRIHWQALKLWLAKVPFIGARPPASPDTVVSSTEKHTP